MKKNDAPRTKSAFKENKDTMYVFLFSGTLTASSRSARVDARTVPYTRASRVGSVECSYERAESFAIGTKVLYTSDALKTAFFLVTLGSKILSSGDRRLSVL